MVVGRPEYLTTPSGQQPLRYRHPMVDHYCPICSDAAIGDRPVGQLTVRTCGTCGHGWLRDVEPTNVHYEDVGDNSYNAWRSDIQEALVARGEQYVHDFVAEVGRAPSSAVELGCATGETIGVLQSQGSSCWAADTAAAAIESASVRYPGVTFSVGELPKPDFPVEAAFLMHVIEHIPDPLLTLRQVRDLVIPGGWIYIRTPNYAGAPARTLKAAWPDYMAEHVHYFTRRSLRQALEQEGWAVVGERTASDAWPWLGGAKRIIKNSRPTAGAAGHGAPPGATRMKALTVATKVAGPILRLESGAMRGNELVVVGRAI